MSDTTTERVNAELFAWRYNRVNQMKEHQWVNLAETLLAERDALALERDALRARVAELESDVVIYKEGMTAAYLAGTQDQISRADMKGTHP